MLLSIMSLLSLYPSSTALTVDNVVGELKNVTWDMLCEVLTLPSSQQDKEYATENQRRNAAVHCWLLNDPYASWRRLITQLDLKEETHEVADQIRPYAEELSGMLGSFLVSSLSMCMNCMHVYSHACSQ